MKRLWLCAAALCAFCLQIQGSERDQDLQEIIKKIYLADNAKVFLQQIALEALVTSGKVLDSEELIQKVRDTFDDPEVISHFFSPYQDFSDEEIRELKHIHNNPVFEKYNKRASSIFQYNYQTIKAVCSVIVDKHGIDKNTLVADTESSVIEITQENFEQEIVLADIPVILEVYGPTCPPCKLMEPIFLELSHEYKGRIRFAKINCDTQNEIVSTFGVTHLPTFMFLKPGTGMSDRHIVGFMAKKDFSAVIEKFLSGE